MSANERIQQSENSQMLTNIIQMPSSYVDDWHSHPWHQIIFPLKGLLQSQLRLKGKTKNIIVPHNGILYIPANTTHKSVAVTNTHFMAIYLNPNNSLTQNTLDYSEQHKSCLVTPLLKALILQLFKEHTKQQSALMLSHLLMVLSDQITLAKTYEIPLLIPKDRRLLAIFTQLQQRPDLALTLADWAVKVGASSRTLSRLCAKEFAQSFSLWRQNIRLVLSLQLLEEQILEEQIPIQNIAMDLGYQSDSAYIYAFKALFMQTPNQYRKDNMASELPL